MQISISLVLAMAAAFAQPSLQQNSQHGHDDKSHPTCKKISQGPKSNYWVITSDIFGADQDKAFCSALAKKIRAPCHSSTWRCGPDGGRFVLGFNALVADCTTTQIDMAWASVTEFKRGQLECRE